VSLSIRARLTLWYTAVLTLVLAASAWASYRVYERSRLARFDEELARVEALASRNLALELDDGLALEDAAHDALEDLELPGRLLAVFAPDGRRLAGRWSEALAESPAALDGRADSVVQATAPAAEPHRLRWAHRRHRGTAFVVGAAESLLPLEQELTGLRRALLGGVLAALLCAAAGGFWIAHVVLRPVASMAAEAARISERTPGFRLTAARAEDELGALARSFNQLLGRLERALAQQREFMADASHELRTPVSVARTAIEVTLARAGRPEPEYRDSLAVVGEQMRRLGRLVDDMFTLARADAGPLPLERGRLYLDELVERCLAESRLLGAAKGVELGWSGPRDLEAVGDEGRLRQMLMNLLDNAVRHTPAGGRVRVELAARPGGFEIAVRDGGGGIPEPERERVFERFVRLDASRHAADGAGLGLPIARMIAEAHGGSLALAESDASGSSFVVRVPGADTA
jgi:heavy metal sensor kinase